MHTLDPARTALILIDLQNGIAGPELAPRSGDEVVETAKNLAARFREADAPVVLVHLSWRDDGADMPSQQVEKPIKARMAAMGEGWRDLIPGLEQQGDIIVLKHHWGAFTGTDLDLQLRRRGVDTIVLAGIATNFGVESTARCAWELSYNVVLVEDATTSRAADLHQFAIDNIFPQISRIVTSEDIAFETP